MSGDCYASSVATIVRISFPQFARLGQTNRTKKIIVNILPNGSPTKCSRLNISLFMAELVGIVQGQIYKDFLNCKRILPIIAFFCGENKKYLYLHHRQTKGKSAKLMLNLKKKRK